MALFRNGAVLALVVAGTLLAAAPSYAFVAVACTVKDAHGHSWRNEYFGLFKIDSTISATSYAMADCKAKSSKPGTCKLAGCVVTHP